MKKYGNSNSNSGITDFQLSADWVRVKFRGASTYEYHADKIGQDTIDEMKSLATAGNGLNTFINSNPAVRKSAFRLPGMQA